MELPILTLCIPDATEESSGLMSAEDKIAFNALIENPIIGVAASPWKIAPAEMKTSGATPDADLVFVTGSCGTVSLPQKISRRYVQWIYNASKSTVTVTGDIYGFKGGYGLSVDRSATFVLDPSGQWRVAE